MGNIARSIGKAAMAGKLAVRSFTDIDTNPVPKEWEHITKVDPEEEKKLPLLYPLYLQHSSAVSVGGSRDVNSSNTEETFELLDYVDIPVFHEPSAARHVTERTREYSEFLAIPEVLNGDSTAIVGTLGEGTTYLRNELVPDLIDDKLSWIPTNWKRSVSDFLTSWLLEQAVFEAYIIQNLDSAAAREANVTEDDLLSAQEAAQRALAAEKHLESPVIYLEYSGTFGGDEAAEMLRAIRDEVSWSRLWYGGGIGSREEANQVIEAGADTVVVGNIFHNIAIEEAELVDRARDEFVDESLNQSDFEAWVASEVEISETAAYRFLTTVPNLSNPERLSEQYISQSIGFHLILSNYLDDGAPDEVVVRDIESDLRDAWESDKVEEDFPRHVIEIVSGDVKPGSKRAGLAANHLAQIGLDPYLD